MHRVAVWMLAALALAAPVIADETRSFSMGFTSWPYAATPEAVESTTAFLRKNGDIVAEQMDNGVPWAALMSGDPLPEKFLREAQDRSKRWLSGPPVFLSATPLSTFRDAIANDVATGKAPSLGSHPFADAAVRDAYVAHCKRLIDLFKPAYFAYAIETNELLVNAPGQASDYAAFIAGVREQLKTAYPALAIGQTVSIHNVLDPARGSLAERAPRLRALLKGDDFAGISYYPFMRMHTDADGFRAAFDTMRTLYPGPLVVSETGEIAEPLYLRALNVSLPGSPDLQSRYIATLLDEAQKRRFKFVINWTHRDYDELLKIFPPALRELGGVWLRTGLLTADGTERPALGIWRSWLERKRSMPMGSADNAPAPKTPAATDEASRIVDTFHDALSKGDGKAALALLDDQVQIYEQGWVERSKAEYASKHLESDMKFSAATTQSQTARTSAVIGDLAYISTEGRTAGKFEGKAVDSMTLETMVLRRAPDGWHIVHIHWSSRKAKK